LAAAVWAALGAADPLFAGSSNPIRDLDLAPINSASPLVYANRGLSGIDGNLSTAAGIALALERPTHALLGDLTVLHDATGLVIGREEPRPDLRLVVANDDGGSIFATLEQGEPAHMGAFERLFGTPQGLQFEALAAAAPHPLEPLTEAELTRASARVRFERSIHVPEDEICFFVFDAPSGRDAALAAQQAELDPIRVVEALSSRKEEL
jgi:2-succinyl-5-enolpyruvyl-6-hydroxy-3-cyclohexene-1-carboxylate synthase